MHTMIKLWKSTARNTIVFVAPIAFKTAYCLMLVDTKMLKINVTIAQPIKALNKIVVAKLVAIPVFRR